MFKIVEIFEGIQGEGFHTGTPAMFVRFYGCNLACPFCDEPKHTQANLIKEMSVTDIVEAVSKYTHVVLTGGEPSLHDLTELIARLHGRNHYVQVETNGFSYSNVADADWVTVSPKPQFQETTTCEWVFADEVKLLANEQNPPAYQYVGKLKYLQPLSNGDELDIEAIKWCADYVLRNPDWKLSIQTHKIYGGA